MVGTETETNTRIRTIFKTSPWMLRPRLRPRVLLIFDKDQTSVLPMSQALPDEMKMQGYTDFLKLSFETEKMKMILVVKKFFDQIVGLLYKR